MIYKFMKFIVVMSFLSLVGAGISFYLGYQKFKDNPEALANLIQGLQKTLPNIQETVIAPLTDPSSVKEQLEKSKDQLSKSQAQLQEIMGETVQEIPRKEFEEKKLLQMGTADEVLFVLKDSDITIEPYDGAELEIVYQGSLILTQKESLIQMIRMDQKMKILFATEAHKIDSLVREVKRQGKISPSPLKAQVFMPRKYRGKVIVQNQRGHINILNSNAQKLDLATTEAGEINIILNSDRTYHFDLGSQDGEIINESGLGIKVFDKYKPQVKARTEQGAITIGKN